MQPQDSRTVRNPWLAVVVTAAAVAAALVALPAPSAPEGVFARALAAHGGLERWRARGTLEYDLDATQRVFGNRERRDEHHLIDLHRRRVLISGDGYRLGFDGRDAWASAPAELRRRPRFYHDLYFYLFGLPFVLADPGAHHEVLRPGTLDGRRHHRLRFTFDPGVGDSPDDEYVAWFDADTHRLRLVLFTVTYYGPRGALIDGHHRAAEYADWQTVDGLTVPRRIRLGVWRDGALVTSPAYSGEATFHNVAFRPAAPAAERFVMPEGGVVDERAARPADAD